MPKTLSRQTVKTPDPDRRAVESLYFAIRAARYPELCAAPTAPR